MSQFFMVGFDGFEVPPSLKDFLKEYPLGGLLLFRRNYASPPQLASLTNELQFQCRLSGMLPYFISIDHEGGKVNRLQHSFTQVPGSDRIGQRNSPKLAFDAGSILGTELKAVGININFAPVVDVYTNPQNSVIQGRAFGSDANLVAQLGSAVIRGIQKAGVMAVAKHFPGHGDVKEDSHFKLPRTQKTLSQLESCELVPFSKAIRSGVDGIMTAHLLNSELDPQYPATLSSSTIVGVLRQKMRYNSMVFADDLEMKAISDHFSVPAAAELALGASVDSLLMRGDQGLSTTANAIEHVVSLVEKGSLKKETLQNGLARIEAAKKKYCLVTKPIDVELVGNYIGVPKHLKLVEEILG